MKKFILTLLLLAIIYFGVGFWLAFGVIHEPASKIDVILKMPVYAWQELKTFIISI